MKAAVVTKPGKIEILQINEPTLGPYQVRVKTELASICNATDHKLITGHFPGVENYPLILGHESVGMIDSIGEKVRNFKIGDRVIGGLLFKFNDPKYHSGWGGFCEYTVANDHDAMVEDGVADAEHGWREVYEIQNRIPSDISIEDAVILCTWREVYAAFEDFNLQAGDNIVIFGAGPVGLSFLKFGKLLGLGFIGIVDPLLNKRQKALSMGANAVFEPGDPAIADLKEKFSDGLDAIIDAVGNDAIINAGLELIKMAGSICVYGVIAEPSITICKHVGPYNFNLYIHQWPTRSRERAALGPLCQWIREGKLSAKDFITHKFPLEQIDEALEEAKTGSVIKTLLQY